MGMVGIGNVSPNYKLTVATDTAAHALDIYNANSSGDGINIKVNSATPSTSVYYAIFRDSGGGIDGSINGNGSGGVNFNTTSDVRLKENIIDTSFGLEDLMSIGVKDYNFIGVNQNRTGFIAQELYKIFPNAVTLGGEDAQLDPWTVDYSRVTPLIVAGVQEMNQIVEKQQREIASLKEENEDMKKRLERLENLLK